MSNCRQKANKVCAISFDVKLLLKNEQDLYNAVWCEIVGKKICHFVKFFSRKIFIYNLFYKLFLIMIDIYVYDRYIKKYKTSR